MNMEYNKPIRLINFGNTCYMNSLLQTLFCCNDISNSIMNDVKDCQVKSAFKSYKKILKIIKENENKNIIFRTTDFYVSVMQEFPYLKGQQQDSSELLFLLLDSFARTTKVNYTPTFFLQMIKNFRYNSKNKNICARNLIENYKKEYSIFNKYFDIHIMNDIYCKECNKIVSRKLDVTNNIQLTIPKTNEKIDIDYCLKKFLEQEDLDEDFKCPSCSKKDCCTKESHILNLPKYIYITFKRFSYDFKTQRSSKNTKFVDYNMNIDMDKYLFKANENGLCKTNNNYKLKATINHDGSLGGGHYYAFVSNIKEEWYLANDSFTKLVNGPIKKNTYMLLYELKK
jgi:ubiquitin C-terminal hydrolase